MRRNSKPLNSCRCRRTHSLGRNWTTIRSFRATPTALLASVSLAISHHLAAILPLHRLQGPFGRWRVHSVSAIIAGGASCSVAHGGCGRMRSSEPLLARISSCTPRMCVSVSDSNLGPPCLAASYPSTFVTCWTHAGLRPTSLM